MNPGPLTARVFGTVSVHRDGCGLDLGSLRHRLVLASLAAAPGQRVAIGDLIDLLWESDPPMTAVNQVQRIVGQLRRTFEPTLGPRQIGSFVHGSGDSYGLTADAWCLDLDHFRRLMDAAGAQRLHGRLNRAAESFAEAVELASEPAFADFPAALRRAPRFWRVERERITAAVALASVDTPTLRRDETSELILRVAADHPLDERLQAAAIDALTVSGRPAQAAAHFHETRHPLAVELGMDPGPELTASYHRALSASRPRAETRVVGR